MPTSLALGFTISHVSITSWRSLGVRPDLGLGVAVLGSSFGQLISPNSLQNINQNENMAVCNHTAGFGLFHFAVKITEFGHNVTASESASILRLLRRGSTH
jgi:hypothetical protein